MKINDIEIEVKRKKIKNIYLRVLPPNGKVSVSCPIRCTNSYLEKFLLTKIDWIKSSQKKYNSCENDKYIHIWGVKYKKQIIQSAKNYVVLEDNLCKIFLKENSLDTENKTIDKFLRNELNKAIKSFEYNVLDITKLHATKWNIRKMKTKWGSCNVKNATINMNFNLIKYPLFCLEYVMFHEITHLMERYHNARFYGLLDNFYKNRKLAEKELLKYYF